MRGGVVKLVLQEGQGPAAEPTPSATIVVVRSSQCGPEVLLLKRNPNLAHMPGAWVFPGGKVDAVDAGDSDEIRARVAACRELREEASLALCTTDLLYFSHWLTPEIVKRRFATWFYLAVVDEHAQVRVDGSEIVDHRWLRPHEALSEQLAGKLQAPPPTLVTLTEIQAAADVLSLRAMIEKREPPFFFPKLHKVGDGMLFLYPGDSGYAPNNPDVPGDRHRMLMDHGVFDYQRSFDWPARSTGG